MSMTLPSSTKYFGQGPAFLTVHAHDLQRCVCDAAQVAGRQLRPAMVRALLVNFFLVTTAALVGMGLLSGKLRQRCFSVSHGVPEHSLSGHRTCHSRRPGPLSGRRGACAGGYACLALGELSVWSLDSASWAALCVTRLVLLNRWGQV
jgi:hypothetical protein